MLLLCFETTMAHGDAVKLKNTANSIKLNSSKIAINSTLLKRIMLPFNHHHNYGDFNLWKELQLKNTLTQKHTNSRHLPNDLFFCTSSVGCKYGNGCAGCSCPGDVWIRSRECASKFHCKAYNNCGLYGEVIADIVNINNIVGGSKKFNCEGSNGYIVMHGSTSKADCDAGANKLNTAIPGAQFYCHNGNHQSYNYLRSRNCNADKISLSEAMTAGPIEIAMTEAMARYDAM